jgi:hypothetical protein
MKLVMRQVRQNYQQEHGDAAPSFALFLNSEWLFVYHARNNQELR